MTTRADLLRAIATDPEDDAAREILADWLDERGDTDAAGSIRDQLALARDDSLDDSLDEDLDLALWVRAQRRLDAWTRPLRRLLPRRAQLVYRRGMPWELRLERAPDEDALATLQGAAPTVRRLRCPADPALIDAATRAWPAIDFALDIRLTHSPFALPDATRALRLHAPALGPRPSAPYADTAARWLDHIAGVPDLRQLEAWTDLPRSGLAAILHRHELRALALAYSHRADLDTPLPPTLRRLRVHRLRVAGPASLPALTHLDGVDSRRLTDDALAGLRELAVIAGSDTGDPRLATAPGLRTLQVTRDLHLGAQEPIAPLLRHALRAPRLRALAMRSRVGPRDVDAIVDAGDRLRWLRGGGEPPWPRALASLPLRYFELLPWMWPSDLAELRDALVSHETLQVLVLGRRGSADDAMLARELLDHLADARPDLLILDADDPPPIRVAWPARAPLTPVEPRLQ